MKWIKVIFINFLVLFILLIVSEIGIRLAWTLRSCINNTCDFSRITDLRVRTFPNTASIGLSQYDAKLGYIPRPNFSGILNFPESGYNKVAVNIDERSFRKNNLLRITQKPQILAVGDSFTFGDQVSDDETWPSCLQKKIGKGVLNAGVFGYGAAQALKRVINELEINSYELIIFSILIRNDFDRDQHEYSNGFPRPAVIKDNGIIAWAKVPDMARKGSKYFPASRSKFGFFYQNSILISGIWDRLMPAYDWSGSNINTVHPKAADVDEIIEWTLTEFSKLNKVNKLLVLQYGESHLDDKITIAIRNRIINLSKMLDLKVVDTYEALKTYDPKILWFGHHTSFGNEVVCDLIKEGILK